MNRRAFRLARHVRALQSILKHVREHTELLDKNWDIFNDGNINAFRLVLGMPGASIPEMTTRIRRLRMRADSMEHPGVN
jgi:hypothetical protein